AEALSLQAQGVKELVLISQDTTRYGEDIGLGRTGLAQLVQALIDQTTFPWIRFLYAYPKTLHDSVLQLMAREDRFLSYVDIPLQHVARNVLSKMKRGGDPASYRTMIERMRSIVPDLTVRSTFIVGFPEETEADFADMASFVEDMKLDNVGVFPYSPEPGSGAEPLGDTVPTDVKEFRRETIMKLQQPIAQAKNRARKGKTFEALLEGPCSETDLLLEGRIRAQAPEIDGRMLINDVPEGWTPRIGELVKVRVTKSHAYDLIGSVVGS
ncbi:MAG: radical SAM protein, partial [Thermoanaerobaculia bacterium]